MSLIKQALWEAYLPGAMPVDCTYEQFSAARDFIWANEDRLWTADWLKQMHQMYNDPLLVEGAKQFAKEQISWAIGELNDSV